MELRVLLCDPEKETIQAWREAFPEDDPEDRWESLEIHKGFPLDVAESRRCDAILCPGNSFGFMDSGFCLKVCERYGWQLQEAARRVIAGEHDGELIVGQAIVIPTEVDHPKWIVYAPVARSSHPGSPSMNPYLALRGALIAIRTFNGSGQEEIRSLAVPALGQDAGKLSPAVAARQVKHALKAIWEGRPTSYPNLSKATRREWRLKGLDDKG